MSSPFPQRRQAASTRRQAVSTRAKKRYKPSMEQFRDMRPSATNNSLDQDFELLGASLHDSSSFSNAQSMLAPKAMQQRKRGLEQITSPKRVSNFAGRHHTNNVPYGSTMMTDSLSFVQPLPLDNSHTSTSSSSLSSSTSFINSQSISAVWQRAWPHLKQMGWTRRERGTDTEGYDFFRPFAIPSIAKYGQDKFRDEQHLLNGLTDIEFAEATGQKAGPSGNVIKKEEGSGQDGNDDDDDDEDDEGNKDNEMEEVELHCSLCESEVCVFRGMKGHLSMPVQNANAAATSVSFSSSSLKSVSFSHKQKVGESDGETTKGGDKRHEIEAENICSVCQEVMSCNSICVPALLVCGHVSTCVFCYERWNEGKLVKLCPMCKVTQTISPIQVDLGYISLDEPQLLLDVTYLTCSQQKAPITISCTLSSTGEEIKKSVIKKNKNNYPEEFLTLIFRTKNKSFILHGNTTLYSIGFQKLLHTLYIQEDKLPFQHKFIQDRLDKMKNSPNTEYQIRFRATKGLGLSDIGMTVQRNHTIKVLIDRLTRYLMEKYYTSILGKKLTILFPRIGVVLEDELTLGELKINPTSHVIFKIFD